MNPDGIIVATPGMTPTATPTLPNAEPGSPTRWAADGPVVFARYAYPPNELGYCGPEDHATLLEYAAAGVIDPGLADLARGFAGAWPYVELIAHSTGIGNPLDRRVVEAYWLGSSLLDRIDMTTFGNSLLDRFRKRAGSSWGFLAEAIPAGALPTHSFHVFGVYPWVGLLRGERSEHPLHILDQCRIRWGRVLSVDGNQAVVMSQPLTFDGEHLGLGPYRPGDGDPRCQWAGPRRHGGAWGVGFHALGLDLRSAQPPPAHEPASVLTASARCHEPPRLPHGRRGRPGPLGR